MIYPAKGVRLQQCWRLRRRGRW